MKRKSALYSIILLFLLILTKVVFADAPPDPGGGPGGGEGPVGGGSPLDGGTFLMLFFGAFYGIKKSLTFLNNQFRKHIID
jgi:hypothetical protein